MKVVLKSRADGAGVAIFAVYTIFGTVSIEELDAERQKQLKLVADLTANSVSASQIDSITGYLDDWESVSFDDKRKVVDILISQIDATSEEVVIHWKI